MVDVHKLLCALLECFIWCTVHNIMYLLMGMDWPPGKIYAIVKSAARNVPTLHTTWRSVIQCQSVHPVTPVPSPCWHHSNHNWTTMLGSHHWSKHVIPLHQHCCCCQTVSHRINVKCSLCSSHVDRLWVLLTVINNILVIPLLWVPYMCLYLCIWYCVYMCICTICVYMCMQC